MRTASGRLKLVMEQKIEGELTRLSNQADVTVFALYDVSAPDAGPVDFSCVDRRDATAHRPEISLQFNGVGIWYFAFRHGETFKVRKVLLRIEDGHFIDAQVGEFEGYWEDFPTYVAEDRWVHSIVRRSQPANDAGPTEPSSNTVRFKPGHRARL